MIEFDLQIDTVSTVNNDTTIINSIITDPISIQNASIVSDGKYYFGYTKGYYDQNDYRVVMIDNVNKENNYPTPLITPFLGCDGSTSTFNLQEGVNIKMKCNAKKVL